MLSSKSQPLVSVIIPTLNAAYLLNNLLSILVDQTYKNIEIITNDDLRTDDNAQDIIDR